MSNVWPEGSKGVRWFGVPNEIWKGGALRRLSHSALKLYIHICRLAQSSSALEIEVPWWDLEQYTGVTRNTRRYAEKELISEKLIVKTIGAFGMTVYVLCHPSTGEPLSAPKDGPKTRRRVKDKDRAEARASRAAAAATKEPKPEPKQLRESREKRAALGVTSGDSSCHKPCHGVSQSVTTDGVQPQQATPVNKSVSEKHSEKRKFYEEISWDKIGPSNQKVEKYASVFGSADEIERNDTTPSTPKKSPRRTERTQSGWIEEVL